MMKIFLRLSQVILILLIGFLAQAQDKNPWVRYVGTGGPGKGKNIVLISGDEEYRSEEALPMLAQILSARYGFTCTVLFSINPQTGEIDPDYLSNIPGLENLQSADLMLIFTRFRDLPPDQMKFIDVYLMKGKPVIGLRTATHAFNYKKNPTDPFARYDFHSGVNGWQDGFGKLVLGETWISHHGEHREEGTRGLINGVEQNARNPLLNGVKDIWVPTDTYTVGSLTGSDVLVYGQSTRGMRPTDPPNLDKSIMPVAWTRTYRVPGGLEGKVFASTMGAAIDLQNEDLRRLLVNACFWATGLEKQIPERADVRFISDYQPTMFGMDQFKKGMKPSNYALK